MPWKPIPRCITIDINLWYNICILYGIVYYIILYYNIIIYIIYIDIISMV